MQAIITEINEKIGATGVVSQECKTVVSQYGQQILDLLLAEVWIFLRVCFFLVNGMINCICTTLILNLLCCVIMQTQPAKICSQVGLCTFDGTHGVRWELSTLYIHTMNITCNSLVIVHVALGLVMIDRGPSRHPLLILCYYCYLFLPPLLYATPTQRWNSEHSGWWSWEI